MFFFAFVFDWVFEQKIDDSFQTEKTNMVLFYSLLLRRQIFRDYCRTDYCPRNRSFHFRSVSLIIRASHKHTHGVFNITEASLRNVWQDSGHFHVPWMHTKLLYAAR